MTTDLATLRWVSCTRYESMAVSRTRHLVPRRAVTSVCGATASDPGVWKANRSKEMCLECARWWNEHRPGATRHEQPSAPQTASGPRQVLAAAQARADAATHGPWSAHDFGHAGQDEPSSIVVHTGRFDWSDLSDADGSSAVAWMPAWDQQESDNASLIAAARTDVPTFAGALVAALDWAQGQAPTDDQARTEGYQQAQRDVLALIEHHLAGDRA